MRKFKDVQGSMETVPELDFNVDTVYERFNIRRDEEYNLWIYDENQYTYKEYAIELNRQLIDTSNYLKEVMGINESKDTYNKK